MTSELKQSIETEKVIDQTVKAAIRELKRNSLLKDQAKTPYQKVEYLLYNYDNFKSGIKNKKEKINDIKNHGLGQKSKSITSFGGNGQNKDQEEIEKEQIKSIKRSINNTERCIQNIDDALNRIDCDKYSDIIKLWYFEGKTREEIAEQLNVDNSTVSRNKTRIINELKIILFADEVLMDIFK